jgi:hypothetical protein
MGRRRRIGDRMTEHFSVSVGLRISHAERLVIATAQDVMGAEDLDRVYMRLCEEEALSYGKLVDIRGARIELSGSDLVMRAGRLGACGQGDRAPLAFLVDDATAGDCSAIECLATARRPSPTFKTLGKALAWLLGLEAKRPT